MDRQGRISTISVEFNDPPDLCALVAPVYEAFMSIASPYQCHFLTCFKSNFPLALFYHIAYLYNQLLKTHVVTVDICKSSFGLFLHFK